MDAYELSTDTGRLDRDLIHAWLSRESYWAYGRSRAVTDRAIDSSLCVGAYTADGAQAAFGRIVTDRATFAWLCDVFVLPEHRARGLGVRLVEAALEHPELRTVRLWTLATLDAHGLYRRFGFAPQDPHRWMVLRRDAPDAGEWTAEPPGAPAEPPAGIA